MTNLRAVLGISAVLACSPLLFGCVAIAGDQEAEVDFKVKELPDGTFFYWNTLTVDNGGADVTDAILLAVTLDTLEPAGTPDLTYISTLQGVGVAPTGERAVFCTAASPPAGEQAITADVAFHDNIVPFFDSTNTLRLEWSGLVNTAVAFPPDGFKVRARLKVEPQ
jgi:hypothetical protein